MELDEVDEIVSPRSPPPDALLVTQRTGKGKRC